MTTDLQVPQIPDLEINKTGPIRKFDLNAINKQLDDGISSLKPGETGAVIGVFDGDAAHLAIVGKKQLGPGMFAWSVVATKPYDGKLEFGGKVKYSW